MTYKQKAQAIYDMIFSGQLLEAFDKYYHNDVVMTEIGDEPKIGKAVNRKFEIEFLESVKELHGAGIDSIASDEENKTVLIENWMDITFQNDVRMKISQVAVQKWDGDLIVEERFYHR